MKKILATLTALVVAAGVSYAGCGKKVENSGNFTFNAETKALTVEGAAKPIALQPTTKITDAAGKETTIDALAGKKIKVVSEHNKADSVQEAKAS